jgi:hypothetical protein
MGISKRMDADRADGFQTRKLEFFNHRDMLESRVRGYLAQATDALAEACFFLLQQEAWMMASLLEYIAFERKLAPLAASQPQKVVDALTREAGLALGDGRRLKQFLEYRNLAQRPPALLVPSLILSATSVSADRQLLEEVFPLLEGIFSERTGE